MSLAVRDSGYGIQVGMLVKGSENVSNFIQLFVCYVCFPDCVTRHKIADTLQVSWRATAGLTNCRAERLQRRQQCAIVLSNCGQAGRMLDETCSGVACVQPS